MNVSEVEFLAEKSNIKIIPNFTYNKIYLISGDVGPFKPGWLLLYHRNNHNFFK